MSRTVSFLFVVGLWGLVIPQGAGAVLVNGDFSSGSDGWTAEGLADTSTGVAVLSEDASNYYSALYQAEDSGPGSYLLEFDFQGGLSDEVPSGTLPDVAFASLYFGAPFSSDVIPLFDLDYLGLYNVAPSAEITSGSGTEWQHFSMPFDSAYPSAIPTFELSDFNYIPADSWFLVDNVSIATASQPVPESGTLLLLGTGLAGIARARRRRRG